MGKVIKFTGSKLLGAELRRLRGGRSLKQIAELSKTPPLSERIATVAAPTLSQIENGISFPSLETLHSLALIYRASIHRLLELAVQERVSQGSQVVLDLDAAWTSFAELLRLQSWPEALAVAVEAELLAESDDDRLAWRAKRALCLRHLGMPDEAISLLLEVANDDRLSIARRWQVERALADALAAAGHLRSAALHAGQALGDAPEDLDAAQRWPLLQTRAYLLLAAIEAEEREDQRPAREAARLLEQALELVPDGEDENRLALQVYRAVAHKWEGNKPIAMKLLEEVLVEAEAAGVPWVKSWALVARGVLHRQQGRWSSAIKDLEEAASMAAARGDASMAFEATFEAYRAADNGKSELAALHLRRCERYHPFVSTRTPNALRYERIAGGSR